jgi:hypothetical protein
LRFCDDGGWGGGGGGGKDGVGGGGGGGGDGGVGGLVFSALLRSLRSTAVSPVDDAKGGDRDFDLREAGIIRLFRPGDNEFLAKASLGGDRSSGRGGVREKERERLHGLGCLSAASGRLEGANGDCGGGEDRLPRGDLSRAGDLYAAAGLRGDLEREDIPRLQLF